MTVTRHASSFVIPSSTSGNYTVPIPGGSVAGDIAVITLLISGSNIASFTPPTGWTVLKSPGYNSFLLLSLWKQLTTADLSTSVVINNPGFGGEYISVEVWGGALSPTSVFNGSSSTNQYTLPSATAPAGSVALYIWGGNDTTASATSPVPTAMTPPAGWTGSYKVLSTYYSLGVWFTSPLVSANAPGGTLVPTGGTAGANSLKATIILPPSVVNNAYIAGSTSASDVLCSVVLAGSTSSADTTLLWTP